MNGENLEDDTYTGPTPRYAIMAMLADDVTREELLPYLIRSLSQIADIDAVEPNDLLRVRDGGEWDRDWCAISEYGVSEDEVGFLLSDVPTEALVNAMNVAMSVALNQLVEDNQVEFTAYTNMALFNLLGQHD